MGWSYNSSLRYDGAIAIPCIHEDSKLQLDPLMPSTSVGVQRSAVRYVGKAWFKSGLEG